MNMTGQAYNSRKKRKGAFGEDRFYTTAIENGIHRLKYMVYIELNMVARVNQERA